MTIQLALLGLGSKHWPIKETVKLFRESSEDFDIQVFDDAPDLFGSPFENLKKLHQTGRLSGVEVQLLYTKSHRLIELDYMKRRLDVWSGFLAKNLAGVDFSFSHTTEHYEGDKRKLNERMEAVRSAHPEWEPINNPQPGKGATLPGQINETHGMSPLNGLNYVASMDGGDAMGGDFDSAKFMRQHHGKAVMTYTWCARFNMQDGKQFYDKAKKQPFPPAIRKGAPNIHHLRSMAVMSQLYCLPGKLPKVKPFDGKNLFKPYSQDTNDGRLDKPLIIVPGGKTPYKVMAMNGEQLGIFEYYGPYNGLSRYYSGRTRGRTRSMDKFGYQIARMAMAKAGSPWVWFTNGEFQWGPVFPVSRFGYF